MFGRRISAKRDVIEILVIESASYHSYFIDVVLSFSSLSPPVAPFLFLANWPITVAAPGKHMDVFI